MDTSGTVLVVDDEEAIRVLFDAQLRAAGYAVRCAANAADARAILHSEEAVGVDAIVLDVSMPHESGLVLQAQLRNTSIPVIMVTASSDASHAVAALKNGAFDYLIKPIRVAELLLAVRNAVERGQMTRELSARRALDGGPLIMGDAVFSNAAMRQLVSVVDQVRDAQAPVMILGERGTGREVVAHLLHARSVRHQGPFVAFSCAAAASPPDDTELLRALHQATGGTVFLREIAELSLPLQASLLRVLQDEELPSPRQRFDARVVVSSALDLADAVRAGRLRQDLFYRLEVVRLQLPPLEERRDEIGLLANHFLERFARAERRRPATLAPDAMQALLHHDWPGNVRELENLLRRTTLLNKSAVLAAEHLAWPQAHAEETSTASGPADEVGRLKDHEAQLMLRALAETHGNVSEAARRLGIGRATFYRRARRYNLPV